MTFRNEFPVMFIRRPVTPISPYQLTLTEKTTGPISNILMVLLFFRRPTIWNRIIIKTMVSTKSAFEFVYKLSSIPMGLVS